MRVATRRASAASAGVTRAGTREMCRMWSRCSFSVTSKHSTLPSAARAATTETSRSNLMKPSMMQGAVCTVRQAVIGSAPLAILAWPLPS